MFSSRTRWRREPNPLARRLAEAKRTGRPIIDLTLSNPAQAGLRYPEQEIRNALIAGDILTYAPLPRGLVEARNAVCGYYRDKGLQILPEHLLLTSGSSEAYSFVCRLLCEPGDTILVPSPSYPLFDYLGDLNDIRIAPYRLEYGGEWHIDTESIRRAAVQGSRAIVMVHPNNPTGTFLKMPELEWIAAFAAGRDMALIVDEVFIDYPLGHDERRAPSTAASEAALTFTINGISKTAGLPQMKLGWVVVSGPADERQEALERLDIVADTYLSVNTPVQQALPRLLTLGADIREEIRKRTRRNADRLSALAAGSPSCSLLPVEGGWYATLRVPATHSEEEWTLRLLDGAAVHVHPGFFFDFSGGPYLVVSLLTPECEFDEGIERLMRVVESA